ncbi:MAG: Ig domain-containing protein, partial [Vicinamibacteria bacterium]
MCELSRRGNRGPSRAVGAVLFVLAGLSAGAGERTGASGLRIRAASVDCDAGRVVLRGTFGPHRSRLVVRLDLGDPSGPIELPVLDGGNSREIAVALPENACSEAGTFRLSVEKRRPRQDDEKDAGEDEDDVQLLSVLDLTLGAPGQTGPPGPPGQVDPAVLGALQSQIATALAFASPVITTTSPLPNGSVGTPYDQPLAAAGGSSPYAWSLVGGGLPAGLTLNATTGGIVGGPAAGSAGSYQPAVQVIDQNGHSGRKSFALTVESVGKPVDVVFLADATGSMGGSIANLKAGMTTSIIPGITSTHSDAAFGLATFRDFPFGSFGDVGDYPYRAGQALTTNVASLQSAVNLIDANGGNDNPESGTEALYLAATGQGVSWPA